MTMLKAFMIAILMGIFWLVHCMLFGCGDDDDDVGGGTPA